MYCQTNTMTDKPVFIIAEAGVNHNGDISLALQLIDAAKEAGADAVKFQTFKSAAVISQHAVKAGYQQENTGVYETQLEMVRKLELSYQDHHKLIKRCSERGIQFLSTPFDLQSVDFLIDELCLPRLKISSGEITNAPLLYKVALADKAVILSTGMACLGEIEDALGVLSYGYLKGDKPSLEKFREAYHSDAGYQQLLKKTTLLHCTTEYPAPFAEVHLGSMHIMHQAFGLATGYSDHTQGIAVSIAAVAMGAKVIEKHFTLDRNMPGPDHKASLEPYELKQMVNSIRQVEKSIIPGRKVSGNAESMNKAIARKSIVANTDIIEGETFSFENIACKRPGNGLSPMNYWQLIGNVATRHYTMDEAIQADEM